MEDFEEIISDDIVTIGINLSRGTINESKKLRELLDMQIASGCKKLIVDLTDCEFIDSTFIGTLVVTFKKLAEKGGKLILVVPTFRRGVLFAVTNTLGFFETFKTRKEAIESFVLEEV